jgi:hypothetical protein
MWILFTVFVLTAFFVVLLMAFKGSASIMVFFVQVMFVSFFVFVALMVVAAALIALSQSAFARVVFG